MGLSFIYRNYVHTHDLKSINAHVCGYLCACLSVELCVRTSFPSHIQSNLNSSNTDGSFTMANSNSFLSPYELLTIAQENQIFREIVLLNRETVCCV